MFVVMGRLRSTVLYGTLALLACLLWLGVDPDMIRNPEAASSALLSAFFSLLVVSPIAYPLLMAVHLAMCKIDERITGTRGASSWFEDAAGAFIEDVRNPFLDIWIPIFRAKDNNAGGVVFVLQWMVAIACLIWAVALVGFLTYGLVTAR